MRLVRLHMLRSRFAFCSCFSFVLSCLNVMGFYFPLVRVMKYARPTYEHSVNGNTTRRINKRIPINVNNIHRISLEVPQHPLHDDRDVPMFGLDLFQLRYQLTNPQSTPPLLSSQTPYHMLVANVR